MIDAERGDAAARRVLEHVGRVEPAAEADLDHAGIGRVAGEGEERGSGGDLEEARVEAVAGVEHFLEQIGEQRV